MTYGQLLGFIILGLIILATIGLGMIIMAIEDRIRKKIRDSHNKRGKENGEK